MFKSLVLSRNPGAVEGLCALVEFACVIPAQVPVLALVCGRVASVRVILSRYAPVVIAFAAFLSLAAQVFEMVGVMVHAVLFALTDEADVMGQARIQVRTSRMVG
ncbi:hypothetical protein CE206_28940 (plasmid) [Achromobacter xylosoxidans]|nr:hypothetical protein CE206_28940 [Achromobacter xylosoxidans]